MNNHDIQTSPDGSREDFHAVQCYRSGLNCVLESTRQREITQLSLIPSVPALVVDHAGSVLSSVVASLYEITERLVLVQTEFAIGGETIRGLCIFVPEPGSLKLILESLGVGG